MAVVKERPIKHKCECESHAHCSPQIQDVVKDGHPRGQCKGKEVTHLDNDNFDLWLCKACRPLYDARMKEIQP